MESRVIEPALTSEEWTSKIRKGSDEALLPAKRIKLVEYTDAEGNWNSLHLSGEAGLVTVNRPDMHSIAAFALHEQPFGFTWEMAKALKAMWLKLDNEGWGDLATWNADSPHRVAGLAIHNIEALLPPEE